MKRIAVDASCLGNPGIMEYRGVDIDSGKEIFHQGPFKDATNNIGEFLALVHALAFLKQKNLPNVAVYTDSITALAWVRNKKTKTTLRQTTQNANVIHLVERALKWLHENYYSNPVLKWETQKLGEIPADFGRK
ncbi:MAG: reverse transcriptase-like protein [Bacteroidales bacterium]|jgi:ribonuclease HI|nr:reverse transcriptase-like protein [Bacteroidales bacterium]